MNGTNGLRKAMNKWQWDEYTIAALIYIAHLILTVLFLIVAAAH
jgi:hypothetical protein